MVPLTSAAILSQRRRRKNSHSLKRSASTPNVRSLSNSDSGMTLAEKRRNKLGYHRTSVACGHCRRRKIRCLLAPDDAQNRCANCIRLKKDCNFFPVDQQPQCDRHPRTSSKADTGGSTSADSSPAMVGGHLPEDFNVYSQLPLSAPYLSARGSIGGELVSPLTRAPLTSQGYEFPQHNRTSWGSPFPDVPSSAALSSPGDAPHPYWGRHADSPMTPGFSPHPSGPASSLHSASDTRSSFTSFAPSAPSRSDSAWSVPARSMSYGLVEDYHMSNQSPYHHPQQAPMELRRRASLMNPPSLQTSNNSSNTSLNEAHMTPLSAPVSTPPLQHWGIPSTWAPLPSSSYVSKAPDYGSWYGEPPLAKVQEEDLGPHYGSEPAILYAGAEQ
ncbi:hypothetical protein OEA41_005488 [Lepraria neglecta]|uniref:Zn(2)-C6 fungal-type domain-containing protein n=1 Tax=Lepraria neglecta TaxID=209136 RepID=A0AAD9YZU8_9LECA|nr:hypothetical protein OEA41_005488 [Lepraria neglecta]